MKNFNEILKEECNIEEAKVKTVTLTYDEEDKMYGFVINGQFTNSKSEKDMHTYLTKVKAVNTEGAKSNAEDPNSMLKMAKSGQVDIKITESLVQLAEGYTGKRWDALMKDLKKVQKEGMSSEEFSKKLDDAKIEDTIDLFKKYKIKLDEKRLKNSNGSAMYFKFGINGNGTIKESMGLKKYISYEHWENTFKFDLEKELKQISKMK